MSTTTSRRPTSSHRGRGATSGRPTAASLPRPPLPYRCAATTIPHPYRPGVGAYMCADRFGWVDDSRHTERLG